MQSPVVEFIQGKNVHYLAYFSEDSQAIVPLLFTQSGLCATI